MSDSKAPQGDAEQPAGKKKLAGKTLILFVVLPAILVLGAGGGAAMLLLKPPAAAEGEEHAGEDHGDEKKGKSKGKGDSHGKAKGGESGDAEGEGEGTGFTVREGDGVYFVSLPQILVNITSADGRPAFLKLQLTLEAPDGEVVSALEPELPRILDLYQSFLRELRTDDMAGSGGAQRVRMELLRRVNLVIAPAAVNAVLIEEMLVQ